MKQLYTSKFNKFFFEFLSIFFAVTFAFLLNNWNDNRKDRSIEKKILLEIFNGLERDSIDLATDENFLDKVNIQSIHYFVRLINNSPVNNDSLAVFYHFLTRDFVTVQNTSGYQTLKSRGLELIDNDDLRKNIIDMYEVNYELYRKFSEEYDENKYMRNYFAVINDILSPKFIFDTKGNLTDRGEPTHQFEREG